MKFVRARFCSCVLLAGFFLGLAITTNDFAVAETGDVALNRILENYVFEFLRRNPTTNTYLGGAGLDQKLIEADGRLRDYSNAALIAEDKWLEEVKAQLESLPIAIAADGAVNRDVALAQIAFQLRQHRIRRQQERALDTYVVEPFRAIDAQLRGLSNEPSDEDWQLIIRRVGAIPNYLAVAQDQLAAGIKSGNTPDWRMLVRDGLDATRANEIFFLETLPKRAGALIRGPARHRLLAELGAASKEAAAAFRTFRDFVAASYFDDVKTTKVKPQFSEDRFIFGKAEYDWALVNNFRITKSSDQLYAEAWPIIQSTQKEIVLLSRTIAATHSWKLPAQDDAAVRFVLRELKKNHPVSDAQMLRWYRTTALRLIDYGRRTKLFDVPPNYRMEISLTPPSIQGTAYYPAPPLKNAGVGQFYVAPTGNKIAALENNNKHSIAFVAAHEGFPGHDWNFKLLTGYRDRISPVRWLTPGTVEDSSSMWMDSMSVEGWAFYCEALMSEPRPNAPNGFYTAEERLYQLIGKLRRELRVAIDVGIHIQRINYNEAVAIYSEKSDFLPGSCADVKQSGDVKRHSCENAEKAIFRYSKWPTQAVTYRLGSDAIYELRSKGKELAGEKFVLRDFHLLFIQEGTIPPGFFRQRLLERIQAPN